MGNYYQGDSPGKYHTPRGMNKIRPVLSQRISFFPRRSFYLCTKNAIRIVFRLGVIARRIIYPHIIYRYIVDKLKINL